jgi:putative transposase
MQDRTSARATNSLATHGRTIRSSLTRQVLRVYLRAYDSVSEARASIGRYLNFYNGRRPHSSLDGVTPDQAYFNSLPLCLAA